MSCFVIALLTILALSIPAHDIPNARVDRSIQATIEPERLRIDYQVGLAELTLTQDLRQVVGELPGTDRRGWFEEYGRVTGPLNAKGLLVTVDGEEVELRSIGFDLAIAGHPLYTFHFEARLPSRGRLTLNDSNYLASEGTSRLAVRPGRGVSVVGDNLPTDVTQIPIQPVWQLDKAEERRTRRVSVDFALASTPEPSRPTAEPILSPTPAPPGTSDGLSWLLDRDAAAAWPMLLLVAFFLGAAHAIQPGHGKTLIAASTLGQGSGMARGALLGLATALVHMASVGLIAAGLWASRAIRPEQVHLTLAHLTGFVIAAIGFWKLGRHLAGLGEHGEASHEASPAARGILPLALAGGVVPCWDAVALVMVSEVIGRLKLGLALLAAFSLGMATVLMAIGALASRFRARFERSKRRQVWERRLGILGGLILSLIGLSLLRT